MVQDQYISVFSFEGFPYLIVTTDILIVLLTEELSRFHTSICPKFKLRSFMMNTVKRNFPSDENFKRQLWKCSQVIALREGE